MEQEVIDKIARSFVDALMIMDRELVKIEYLSPYNLGDD